MLNANCYAFVSDIEQGHECEYEKFSNGHVRDRYEAMFF
jgi:hypothetical protein